MSDLVKRLRDADTTRRIGESYADTHERRQRDREEAADRIEQLEAENASLATWQCEFTDGKTGLVYGQGGTTFCIMAKRMQQLEAELIIQYQDGHHDGYEKGCTISKEASERYDRIDARIEQLEAALRDIIQDSYSLYAISVARAALEGRT